MMNDEYWELQIPGSIPARLHICGNGEEWGKESLQKHIRKNRIESQKINRW